MDVSSTILPTSPSQQQQQLSCEMSLTPTLQQTQSATMSATQLSPVTPVTPTTPRTTTHTPRELPTMYILEDLYDDDYIDQFNSYNITTPTEEADPSVSSQLAPCPICSRTFNPVTLRKHVGICEKMATKRRKVFDSSRQRREGTELASYPLPKNFGLPDKAASNNVATKTKAERSQSPIAQQVSSPVMQRKKPTDDLVRSTARTSMRKLSTASANDIPTTNFNRDRMRSSDRSLTRRGIQPSPGAQCPHCDRCFGFKAYDRHVEWCKEKALQASIKQSSTSKTDKVDSVAKARLEARTKYKAPCLKTKRSVNRDKYSGFPDDENEDSPKTPKFGNKTHELMSSSMTSSMTSESKNDNNNKSTGNSINEATAPSTSNTQNQIHSRDTVTHTPSYQLQTTDEQLSDEFGADYKIEMPEQMMAASGAAKKLRAGIKDEKNLNATQRKHMTKTNKQNVISSQRTDYKLPADVVHATTTAAAASQVFHKKSPNDLSLKTKRQIQCKESQVAKRQQSDDVGGGEGGGEIAIPGRHERLKEKVKGRKVDFKTNSKFYISHTEEESDDDNTPPKCFDNEPIKPQKMTMAEYFNEFNESNDMVQEPLPRSTMKKSETFNLGMQDTLIVGSKKVITSRKEMKKLPVMKSNIANGELKTENTSDETSLDERPNNLVRCEDMVNNGESLINSNLSEDPKRMVTMSQSYSETCKQNAISEADETDEEDLQLGGKSYLDIQELKANNGNVSVKPKSIENIVEPQEVQNKVKTAKSKQNTVTQVDTRDDYIGKELLRQSSNLSDVSCPFSLHLKKSKTKSQLMQSQNKSEESLNTLDSYKIGHNNFCDCEESASSETTSARVRSASGVTADAVSLKSVGQNLPDDDLEDDVDNLMLKNCPSASETFIKTDSDSDESFVTPPEEKDFNRGSISPRCDEFKTLSPNCTAYSSPQTTPRAETPPKKDIAPREKSKQNETKTKKTKTRALTPRGTCSTVSPLKSAISGSLPNTPRSVTSLKSFQIQAKLETSAITSLNIYPLKRTKVLRQMISSISSSSGPMKAIPFTNEAYGVCSQIKNVDKDEETDDEKYEIAETGEDRETKDRDLDSTIIYMKDTPRTKLERNSSFTLSGLPDNYDPFLSAKRQLEELCSPSDSPKARPTTPQLPNLPATPAASANRMSTSFTLGSSSSSHNTSSPMTTSQTPQTITPKTPTLARSSSFRRTGSLRGPRRSPLLTQRVPLFAQKHRPTIQRGLSDEGPISSNFLKPEEFDEMPVRSVCVNDYALTKSPRVVRRDTSASNRRQPLKLNINAANNAGGSLTPDTMETESAPNTASRYVSKTDSLAVFLKYETELEKLNKANNSAEAKKQNANDENSKPSQTLDVESNTPSTKATGVNLDGPLNAKELKDKSNNLSKQNSAKNIKAEFLEQETNETLDINLSNSASTNSTEIATLSKSNSVRLTPLSKPSTPIATPNTTTQLSKPTTPVTKPTTPLLNKPTTPLIPNKPSTPLTTKPHTPLTKPSTPLTPLNVKVPLLVPLEQIKPQKPVALSSLFHSEKNHSDEHKNSLGTDYIDPKLINKCDNLPVNLNKLRGSVFKANDSETLDPRTDHFSSSSSESSVPVTKFLPNVKMETPITIKNHSATQNLPTQQTDSPLTELPQHISSNTQAHHNSLSQRNSAEGRNLLKRRMRLGRNQFLYDASPEIDSSCSADDEANRSSLECERLIKEQEMAFERFNESMPQKSSLDVPFIPPPPLPAEFEDFDFEEFLSSFENDEEQFPLFKDCREFLLNRTSKKQRSMLIPNSNLNPNSAQTNQNTHNSATQHQHTFPPLITNQQTQNYIAQQQHQSSPQNFQFPNLPQHKSLFDSFPSPHTNRSKNRTLDPYPMSLKSEEKREIFISIETEQNDLDKSPISPNSIRHMVGNPQCVVEVEVDAHSHDNKFSKISDDDDMDQHLGSQHTRSGRRQTSLAAAAHQGGKQFCGLAHLPNVQLNNAKNLIQKMQEDFRHLGEEMSTNMRQSMEHQRSLEGGGRQGAGGDVMQHQRGKAAHQTNDVYVDSDELSSLDGYPLSSPSSRLGVCSKTSADSAYGSLSRQRSSELSQQQRSNSSRHRPSTTATGNNSVMSRPLAEERTRQLSASSSSSSEHALPPIGANLNYQKQQRQQQQQHHMSQHYSNNNNNNNNNRNNPNDIQDDMMHYERNNNNFDPSINNNNNCSSSAANNGSSNHETTTAMSASSNQLYGSSSTMSSSMKMSKFCHECGSRFVLEQAKFCMDCGVKRIVL